MALKQLVVLKSCRISINSVALRSYFSFTAHLLYGSVSGSTNSCPDGVKCSIYYTGWQLDSCQARYAKLSVQANPSSLRSFWQLQVRFRCDDQQKDVTENNNSGSSRGFSRWERRFHSSLVVMNSVGLLLFLFLAAPVQVSAKALTFSTLNPKLFLSLFQHVMES